jgi:hypothetical protein
VEDRLPGPSQAARAGRAAGGAAIGRRAVRVCPGVTTGMLWSACPGQFLLLRR